MEENCFNRIMLLKINNNVILTGNEPYVILLNVNYYNPLFYNHYAHVYNVKCTSNSSLDIYGRDFLYKDFFRFF